MRRSQVVPSHPTVDIIPGRFVFSIAQVAPETSPQVFCFSVEKDPEFTYQPFYADFGPLSLLQIHIFLIVAVNHLGDHECLVHFYCSNSPQHIANSILLVAAFRLIYMQLSVGDALLPFSNLLSRARPFRDASAFPSTYDLSIPACIHGLDHAIKAGWYDPGKFDPRSWADNEMIQNGDMNWLIPGKLLAFASPYSTNIVQGYQVCTPSDMVPRFQALGVTTIIRLNNKTYDEQIFKAAGFQHLELYFADGSCPPDRILQEFLAIMETPRVIALHCKAGLGRTGTLAGCYLIKKYGFSAAEAIAWIRLCRPGSVIGPQQHYLVKYFQYLHREVQQPLTCHGVGKGQKQPHLAIPSAREASRTSNGAKKILLSTDSRSAPASRALGNNSNALHIQAVGIVPQVPQPRKLQRAQNNSRRTPRKPS
jgi:cell division cycle 14